MGDDQKPLNDPLYGAPPPPTTSTGSVSAPTAPSTSVVNPDKTIPIPEPTPQTTNPLYGATPPPASSLPFSNPPRITPRSSRLPLTHPSGLPAYLRKLGYILSIVLGSSAVIAGVWSIFILPLLHASFSARRALVDQQKDRWMGLVSGLREIRARAIYPLAQSDATENTISPAVVREGKDDKANLALEKTREEARLIDHEDNSEDGLGTDANATDSLLPINTILSLSTSLQNLTTAFTSTSTTRTSLLSTLESYTSHLHRQLYLRSQPSSGIRYGMNTLSANLAKAGGKSSSGWGAFESSAEGEENVGVKGEEWDAVRKEVRAIKGMLLSRRNFLSEGDGR